jgi:hypothetical protein
VGNLVLPSFAEKDKRKNFFSLHPKLRPVAGRHQSYTSQVLQTLGLFSGTQKRGLVCSKIINHLLIHGLFSLRFKFFG